MTITRAFYISFRVPSKGAPSPGPFHRAPIERDATFPEPPTPFNYLSEFPVNGPPLYSTVSLWTKVPVSRAFARPGSGAPTESDVRPLSPPPHILPDPRKGGLQQISHIERCSLSGTLQIS